MPDTQTHTPANCSLKTHCHEHLTPHIEHHNKIKKDPDNELQMSVRHNKFILFSNIFYKFQSYFDNFQSLIYNI
jgi:hypothetical protein